MKVVAICTLVSPQGEYGGPVRVAANQLRALQDRGHEVLLAAGARGFTGRLPSEVEGVPAALFPVRRLVPRSGFAGLTSPALLAGLGRLTADADVVHVHAARDLITLPAADRCRRRRLPYVLQTHGMIDRSDNALARPLDRLLTRPVLAGARAILHLTETERSSLLDVGAPPDVLRELPNGVPAAEPTSPGSPAEVLYLARLAPRKRPMMFVEAAGRLTDDHPGTRFRLVGPDEGEGDRVRRACEELGRAGVDIAWEGPVAPERSGDRMSGSSVYVLPSVDEPYPMSVLEAMARALPVIITDTCGLAPEVMAAGAGVVVDDSLESLVSAVRRMLDDPADAQRMGTAGRRYVRENLDMAVIASALERIYRPTTQ